MFKWLNELVDMMNFKYVYSLSQNWPIRTLCNACEVGGGISSKWLFLWEFLLRTTIFTENKSIKNIPKDSKRFFPTDMLFNNYKL